MDPARSQGIRGKGDSPGEWSGRGTSTLGHMLWALLHSGNGSKVIDSCQRGCSQLKELRKFLQTESRSELQVREGPKEKDQSHRGASE